MMPEKGSPNPAPTPKNYATSFAFLWAQAPFPRPKFPVTLDEEKVPRGNQYYS